VKKLIFKQFKIRRIPELVIRDNKPDDRFAYIEGSIIPFG
jgi:hypothetical protein